MPRIATLILLIGLALTPGLSAQEDAASATASSRPDPTETTALFSESVSVRVVNIEVYVSDRKGRPIKGLTRDDFELYENGRQVEITNFYAESGPAEASRRGVREVDVEEVGAPEAIEGRGPGHLVIYIDNYNLRPGGRKRLLDDLREFLTTGLEPDVPVMLVTHGSEGLRPLLEPTTDRAKLVAHLNEIEKTPAGGLRADVRRREVLRRISDIFDQFTELRRVEEGPCELGESQMIRAVEDYAYEEITHNEVSAKGISLLASALAGLPDLKTVIYAGDGLPQFSGTELFAHLADVCPERASRFMANYNRFDTSRLFTKLTELANSHQVTIHTLEARGAQTHSISSVDAEGSRHGRQFTPSPMNDRIRIANTQATLYQIAEETGGRAILNANDMAPELAKVRTDMTHYYSLGFQSTRRGDGRSHRIRVEVPNEKYRLRFRKSYRDRPLEETLVARTLGALIFDFETNPLEARVEVAPPASGEEATSETLVRVAIPRSRLTLLPVEDRHEGRLRLILTARDSDNKLLPIKQKEVPIVTAEAPAESEGPSVELALFDIGIELPPGSHELALAIRDEASATTSFLRRTVNVDG